jgi:plastocyanin
MAFAGAPGAAQQAGAPPPNPAQTDQPALIVHLRDSAYAPDTATVKIGQAVQFQNDDKTGHTVTALDGSFDSGYLGKGDSWRITFTRTGTVRFSDLYHPAMHGSISVVN